MDVNQDIQGSIDDGRSLGFITRIIVTGTPAENLKQGTACGLLDFF